MDFAKKFALVPEDSLSKHVPTQQHMSDFDKQMSKILNSTLNEYEKVQRYYGLLQRKMNLENFNTPMTAIAMEEDEENNKPKPTSAMYNSIVLESVPASLKKQASTLLQMLERNPTYIQWNAVGEISVKGRKLVGSNLADLFNMIFTNRKHTDIVGMRDFLSILQELNAPTHYIKNKQLSVKPPMEEEGSKILIKQPMKREVSKIPVKHDYVKNWLTL